MQRLSDVTLEIVASNGYNATEFKSENTGYYIAFPNMLDAARFAHAPAIREQFHTGIESIGKENNIPTMWIQDPFNHPVVVWLTHR